MPKKIEISYMEEKADSQRSRDIGAILAEGIYIVLRKRRLLENFMVERGTDTPKEGSFQRKEGHDSLDLAREGSVHVPTPVPPPCDQQGESCKELD